MKINLDIHELSVLIEAAWGGGTGLRMEIMRKAIDEWYEHVSVRDRLLLHRFFSNNMKVIGEGDVRRLQEMFMARYKPGNEYVVVAGGRTHRCFRFGDAFYTDSKWHIPAARAIDHRLAT